MFNEVFLAETPATDPKSVIGRNIEVSVAELLNDQKKYYMKLIFKLTDISGKTVYTRFNGFECTRDHVFRMVRKRTQKTEIIHYVNTKDGWKLQITMYVILNRNTTTTIQTTVRKKTIEIIENFAKNSEINDFVKAIVSGALQAKVKKECSKIYPVRISEVIKVEVIKTPAS